MTLVDLPNRKVEVAAKLFSTAAKGVSYLTKNTAITTAGDRGAINAWKGDDGMWHAHVCRCHSVTDEWVNATKHGLREWLEKSLNSIR